MHDHRMKNARHVIAVTLMATAICADRSLSAAPAEPQASHFAGRIIQRLSVNLRRVVPATCLYQPRRFGLPPAQILHPRLDALVVDLFPPLFSPFQFRLPPPIA
ncbi:MAG: hypothetical protein ABSD28_08815 [Tepidisphaeraceae bacterium]|jgi:hypothetical protein